MPLFVSILLAKSLSEDPRDPPVRKTPSPISFFLRVLWEELDKHRQRSPDFRLWLDRHRARIFATYNRLVDEQRSTERHVRPQARYRRLSAPSNRTAS